MQIGAKSAKNAMCLLLLSFHVAYHHWWLGRGCCLFVQRGQKVEEDMVESWGICRPSGLHKPPMQIVRYFCKTKVFACLLTFINVILG